MRFDVFTILPEVMQAYLASSILGRAQLSNLIDVRLHNLRDYTEDKHHTTDDEPFGGGGGMVMKPEPIFSAVETVLDQASGNIPVILLTPQGRPFSQSIAKELAQQDRLALICGRYEGVDERVRQYLVTDELSIGDYVLTGGEIPSLVLIDSISRLIPGVLGDSAAPENDTFARGLLEHAHYTRPADFRGWEVPEILRSGDHARIRAWRNRDSILRTNQRRPDLLRSAELTDDERRILETLPGDEGTEDRE
jgi:tRNA (guanine37-N1)-methyltransferase